MRTFHWICFGVPLVCAPAFAHMTWDGFRKIERNERNERIERSQRVEGFPGQQNLGSPHFLLAVGGTGEWSPDWDPAFLTEIRLDFLRGYIAPAKVPTTVEGSSSASHHAIDPSIPLWTVVLTGSGAPTGEQVEPSTAELEPYRGGIRLDPSRSRRLTWRVEQVLANYVGTNVWLEIEGDHPMHDHDADHIEMFVVPIARPAAVFFGLIALPFGWVLYRDRKPMPKAAA